MKTTYTAVSDSYRAERIASGSLDQCRRAIRNNATSLNHSLRSNGTCYGPHGEGYYIVTGWPSGDDKLDKTSDEWDACKVVEVWSAIMQDALRVIERGGKRFSVSCTHSEIA